MQITPATVTRRPAPTTPEDIATHEAAAHIWAHITRGLPEIDFWAHRSAAIHEAGRFMRGAVGGLTTPAAIEHACIARFSSFAYGVDEWAAELTAAEWIKAVSLLEDALRTGALPDFMIGASGCRPLAEL